MKNTNKGTEYAYGYIYDPYTEKKRTTFPIILGIISVALAMLMPVAGFFVGLLAVIIARKKHTGYAWIGAIGMIISALYLITAVVMVNSVMSDPAVWNTIQDVVA